LIKIEPITRKNAFPFKTVRLCALQDAPHAFSSTYAKESQFADVEWLQRADRLNGERGAGFLAMDGDEACGIVGAFLDSNDGTRAQLVSMWTAPTHRHRGIGRLLVNEVLRWAHLRGASALLLMVTSNNEPAMRFYERLGFSRTGRSEPYPNDPGVTEYEMLRPILAGSDS
jgi:ribosomal protein S18 acetylase RimI-like enzyme